MSSVNMVIVVGHLGADPEVRYTPDGKAIANLRLATSERFTDKAGEKQEKTEWHRVVFFNKAAEVLGEHAKKGSLLFVEGKLSTRSWTDKQNQTRYSTEVVGNRFQFLGGGKAAAPEDENQDAASTRAPAKAGAFDDMMDDIPFAPIARGIGGHAL